MEQRRGNPAELRRSIYELNQLRGDAQRSMEQMQRNERELIAVFPQKPRHELQAAISQSVGNLDDAVESLMRDDFENEHVSVSQPQVAVRCLAGSSSNDQGRAGGAGGAGGDVDTATFVYAEAIDAVVRNDAQPAVATVATAAHPTDAPTIVTTSATAAAATTVTEPTETVAASVPPRQPPRSCMAGVCGAMRRWRGSTPPDANPPAVSARVLR